jgi:hypothetical protein
MMMRLLVGVMIVAPLLLVVVLVPAEQGNQAAAGPQTSVAGLPPLAAEMAPLVEELLGEHCPQVPTVFVLALVQVESSWDPQATSPVGASGLVQMMRSSWLAAGGTVDGWPAGGGAGPVHEVRDPVRHFELAVPWMCGNYADVSRHLAQTGKPLGELEGLAVCHIAGCGRVYAAATGMPEPGDAGCGAGCVAQVEAYVDRIGQLMDRLLAASTLAVAGGAAPVPEGTLSGCVLTDPTGTGGCVTPTMAWLVEQATFAVGEWPYSVACWAPRPGNPTSDHPHGRACDYTVGAIGRFPTDAERAVGWQLASWMVDNATALDVRYVIFDGLIWTSWGGHWRAYTGGGIYNPNHPTGGHYDHIHVSVAS